MQSQRGAECLHSLPRINIPMKSLNFLNLIFFSVHQSDFQVAAHIPSIRALSLSGQQQDMKQVTAFEKTSDGHVFGSNTQSLPG